MRKTIMLGLAALATTFSVGAAQADGRIDDVRERGQLRCTAHNGSNPGFAQLDAAGNWSGFDVDMCRVFATALFGTHEGHLDLVPISWAQRWTMLQSGELDVVIKQSGWTLSRDTELGFNVTRPYNVGTFQLLVPKSLGIASFKEMDGGTICAPAGTTNERVVSAFAKNNDIQIELVSLEKWEELLNAYFEGRCDGYVGTAASVAVSRMNASNPDDHMILPDVLAVEGQSWFVKEGDERYFDLANWALNVLWLAEQEGITSENVDEFKANPPSPEVAVMLGATPGVGKRFGLPDDWAYNVIKVNGNYAQIWDRNIGKDSPFKLERGINALWKDGGVHYPVTFD